MIYGSPSGNHENIKKLHLWYVESFWERTTPHTPNKYRKLLGENYSPHTEQHSGDDLYDGDRLGTATARAIVEVHVVVAVHVQQDLHVPFRGNRAKVQAVRGVLVIALGDKAPGTPHGHVVIHPVQRAINH
jgi:hypothetical protein